ncbi:MAG: hypothetical protein RL033_7667 [Pseudomonadota bacterium]|jgi:hypothetical protein
MFLLGMLLSAALAWLLFHVVKRLARVRRVRRAARASHAERAAARVLAAQGYSIVGRQVRQRWSLLADGQEVGFELIADYLVESEGVRWIAEVKTGQRALDLRYGPTRRQMLEYRQAFGVDGVLLVDAEAEQVRCVRFREPPGHAGGAARSLLRQLLCLGIGLVLGLALARSWPSSIERVSVALEPAQPPCPPGNLEPDGQQPGNARPSSARAGSSRPGNSRPGGARPGITRSERGPASSGSRAGGS